MAKRSSPPTTSTGFRRIRRERSALFDENPVDFERWAVSLVDGQPNEKQVGDKGIDGRIRFYSDQRTNDSALRSCPSREVSRSIPQWSTPSPVRCE